MASFIEFLKNSPKRLRREIEELENEWDRLDNRGLPTGDISDEIADRRQQLKDLENL